MLIFIWKFFQRPSSIQGAGEGVFLLRDAPVRRFVSLYSGLLYDYPTEANIYSELKVSNTSKSDEYRRACKKYSLGLSTYHTTIDIPPELDLPETFHPTLGPKVCVLLGILYLLPVQLMVNLIKFQCHFCHFVYQYNIMKLDVGNTQFWHLNTCEIDHRAKNHSLWCHSLLKVT